MITSLSKERTNSESARYMFHESFMPFSPCHEVEVLATPMLNIKAIALPVWKCLSANTITPLQFCREVFILQLFHAICQVENPTLHPRTFWDFESCMGAMAMSPEETNRQNYLMWFPCSFSQRQKTDVACHRWLWQKRLSIFITLCSCVLKLCSKLIEHMCRG